MRAFAARDYSLIELLKINMHYLFLSLALLYLICNLHDLLI